MFVVTVPVTTLGVSATVRCEPSQCSARGRQVTLARALGSAQAPLNQTSSSAKATAS